MSWRLGYGMYCSEHRPAVVLLCALCCTVPEVACARCRRTVPLMGTHISVYPDVSRWHAWTSLRAAGCAPSSSPGSLFWPCLAYRRRRNDSRLAVEEANERFYAAFQVLPPPVLQHVLSHAAVCQGACLSQLLVLCMGCCGGGSS